ncbi:alcohol dehydrogenase [Panus rudis PR-1116 ss-1]|nr:alcohol dehydrogenase [Panus rudis PR-1116 ss-1]
MTSETQRAVRFYPPAYEIRVDDVPVPKIIEPDDAIVKVTLAGLCGSDLHVYRGHEEVDAIMTSGHEFLGEVIALGASFSPESVNRPELYRTLKIGDKVISPFTVSCEECHFCRLGFSSRCIFSALFGTPDLPGGQAQYVRVPKAGGTLFKVDSITSLLPLSGDRPLSESSLLLLADILPTGAFAALQALQHPKLAPIVNGSPYPYNSFTPNSSTLTRFGGLVAEDRTLTVAVVGLGPVGICAIVSLLEILADLKQSIALSYRVIAIDPIPSRREKVKAVLNAISSNAVSDPAIVADIEESKEIISKLTNGVGCNAVLEIVGNNSALSLAYNLVRPFGVISSVGVHQAPPIPFTGRDVYNKNVSFDFGRCPVRAMLPIASAILLKRQDVFGGVGEPASLIDRVVGFDEAVEIYKLFDKGECGKVLFDPWRSA